MGSIMRRLLFPAFIAGAACVAVLVVAACDPDLTIHPVPGEAGPAPAAMDGATAPPVDSGVVTEAGPPSEGGMEAGPMEHQIDGTNDFTAGEQFATTSAGYNGYVAYDDKKIYFGMSGNDVGSKSNQKWVLIYVDGNLASLGNAGTTSGIAYDCGGSCAPQPANLPFAAGYHIRWKADGNYTNVQKWNGTAWVDHVANLSSVAQKGTFMELSITRALLGAPTKLKVHMTMLIEQDNATEWTYSGVPSTSFTDGKAPAAYTKYFEFDLSDASKAPNTYATKP
jgi:hypothetical protein